MAGLIVENYKDCSTRPKIKIFMHDDKEVPPYFINLKNDFDSLGIVITGSTVTGDIESNFISKVSVGFRQRTRNSISSETVGMQRIF